MIIEHKGSRPSIHPTAYIAPNAVVSGNVSVGPNCSVLFGAVITASGGAIEIGSDCVIMENAVLRGTPRNPLELGKRVLVGPHAHLSGCIVEDDCFLATGTTVFNGARLGKRVEVRINGVVHVNSTLSPDTVVPIGWVAVGQPAEILPADKHAEIWEIQKSMDFPGTVFSVGREVGKGERTKRYSASLRRHHAADRIEDEAP